VVAAGLVLASGAAVARERGTPAGGPRPEPSEALRKRIADQRYFDVVQKSLRFAPPPPVAPPRFR
jgi:hypothetical protein